MRAAWVLVIVALAAPASADPEPRKEPAKPAVEKPPRTPGPDDAKAKALLDQIVAGKDRDQAIAELNQLAPRAIDAIGEWLVRPHQADVATRRAVLESINASVPDKAGKFKDANKEKTAKQQKADDDREWLKELVALDAATPGLGEVIGDDAAIRALAQVKDPAAAQPLFDAAFADETMIYRDECGRWLRKLEPYSIPVLTRESQIGTNYDRKRYATFQIERLDRQDPTKALAAAMGNEALQIAILGAFRATRQREAVRAVWSMVNNDAPRVREAARAGWMDYITGPPPPPAPRKKLQLAGGKLTKKPKPLWLTYRELADNELRKAANELLHEDYPIVDPSLDDTDREVKEVKIDLEDVTKRLWAYYDGERGKRDTQAWLGAKAKADAGDFATAALMIDRLIATNPERAERADMAKIYFAYGKELEKTEKWPQAAAAFSKAAGLDPASPQAKQALAAHHFALGKAAQAGGKDGGPDFRAASKLDPEHAEARSAADSASGGRPGWMLVAATIAGMIALALFGAAMLMRRRRA
jgi:tetratricopeptide (TPR) repeat protein